MKCRNCGTEIADKALICYRCGVATTAPRIQPPSQRPRRSPIPVIVAMLLIIAAAAAGLPYLQPGPPRIAGWVALVVVTFVAVRLLGPGRFGRKR
jgi:hypothetical protein